MNTLTFQLQEKDSRKLLVVMDSTQKSLFGRVLHKSLFLANPEREKDDVQLWSFSCEREALRSLRGFKKVYRSFKVMYIKEIR